MSDEFRDDDADSPNLGNVTESIRKAVVGGLNTLLTGDDSIKSTIGELPKDALGYVVGQAEKSRKELVRVVTNEIRGFLGGMDMTHELRKALLGLKVEVNASIRFVDEEHPEVKMEHVIKHPDADADTDENC